MLMSTSPTGPETQFPAAGRLPTSRCAFDRAGERTAFVTEQFRLNQRRTRRRQIHRIERAKKVLGKFTLGAIVGNVPRQADGLGDYSSLPVPDGPVISVVKSDMRL